MFIFWVVLLFPSPFGWCCLPSPLLGGAASLSSFSFWVCSLASSSFEWSCFLPLLLRGAAFLPLLWVAVFLARALGAGAVCFVWEPAPPNEREEEKQHRPTEDM